MVRGSNFVRGLAPSLLGMLLLACGGGADPYPENVRQNFLTACRQSGGGETCECSLREIEKEYSIEEYTAMETRMANTGEIPEELVAIIAKCVD